MKVNVTFRHMEPTTAIKDYVEKKLAKVKRYVDEPIEANVVLSLEKYRNIAEVTLSAGRNVTNCEEETDDIYSAIDKVMDKLERQLKKQKDKIRGKKKGGRPGHREFVTRVEAHDVGAEAAPEWEKRIAVTEDANLKPVGVEEAVLWMDMNPKSDFLVFTNSTDGKINVMYRRKDGQFGLIRAQA
ncbi:MAG: ribosome-associated translation inhibitor RaiA [Candidatus Lernaella stagnicola]|nr:ribosome-associated translation inhibitor RaiA [Candidatus Lernaella stagnicola]